MIVRQKIAVTGANGQVGKELRECSFRFPQFDFDFLSRQDLQIDNNGSVKKYFDSGRPQVLINAAAYTTVDKAEEEKEEAFRVNAEAVGDLASVCNEYNTKFIHISTDYVFDGKADKPYKEDDPVNPQSVYGASKLKGEQLALAKNPDTIIIRSSWIYSEYGKNFVKTMLRLLTEKKQVNVVSDQFGSPTYAADLAETILEIIASDKSEPGIYHYSNDGAINWCQFAEVIQNLIGTDCSIIPITTADYPAAAKRPAWSVLNKEKIQRVFDIKLKPWKESLRVCLSRIDIETGIN